MGGGSSQEQLASAECSACQTTKLRSSNANPRPPSRAEIGRAAWRYVHCMAANYPEEPALSDQATALSWLRAFVRFYPCQLCGQEFIEVCSDLPPRLASRRDYAMWWCEAHNRVRNDLSQSLRRCEPEQLLAFGASGKLLDE
eukprot:TRINITY_DN59759_c0_g1_i1.p1 TRINITY_DN59759_c0_g1~~TRINITY_DN59759_c0_g1_i1.p1  ORF type:complete len:142 (-),score=19.59 TRINITY_DN59759_c0_g1_i1:160-585(-)